MVAKGIFVTKRSRPDISPTISVLSGRVREPNKEDWRKCRRLLDYLKGSMDKHLILRVDEGVNIINWFVDASFAVHEDFKSHSGGILTLSRDGGG